MNKDNQSKTPKECAQHIFDEIAKFELWLARSGTPSNIRIAARLSKAKWALSKWLSDQDVEVELD